MKATKYEVSRDGIGISFSMENPEVPELMYGDEVGRRRYSGPQIELEKVQLGLMATVILESVPDLHTVTFSLVIPDANILDDAKSVPIKTFGIKTTSRTSIGGPDLVQGQIQTYETHAFEGNAW